MHSICGSLESLWSTLYSSWLNFFHYLLRLRRYKDKSVEVGMFQNGVGHFEHKFQTEGGVAHQTLLVSEN